MSEKIAFEETIAWFQKTDYDGPVGLTVRLPVPQKNVEEFGAFLEEYIPYVLEEDGCIEFGFHRDWREPNIFWLTERWALPKILLEHLSPNARKGTKFEGDAPLKIMAALGAAPDPAAIFLPGLGAR